MPFIQNAHKPAAKFGVPDTTDTQISNVDAPFVSMKNSATWNQRETSSIWASNNQSNSNNNKSPFMTPLQMNGNTIPRKTSPIHGSVHPQRSSPLNMPDADFGRISKRKEGNVDTPQLSQHYSVSSTLGILQKGSPILSHNGQPSGELNQKTTISSQKRSPAVDQNSQSRKFPILGANDLNKRTILSADGTLQKKFPVVDNSSQDPIFSGDDVAHRMMISSEKASASQVSTSQARNKSKPTRDQALKLFASDKLISDTNNERDEVARERRFRRFNDGMNQNVKTSGMVHQQEQENVRDKSVKVGNRFPSPEKREADLNQTVEMEEPDGLAERDWQCTEPILGACPDMCAESERHERERKGDLDRLERLDGDRNKTSIDLAVKKYTRTAEKHPSLIRPISVLSMTMDHLLGLLNRGYDDELLGLHNFLWDRMRAIRMDLRMQHIFNMQAVFMHEQMIRFHILAMHELCEYVKGEGFTEGFDAHLNIEQMNKTSVDLFHMYDDLRKSGSSCPNEAELRGYYALLKLDKHPGYVVEPAELSLDLAKMTPEMRNTPDVQFARKVARACRSGNYLAFFRLARDATYLQACLMHAHFSKLRSQAIASLYSGLQKNQGIPLFQVADWLAMEVEDVEDLVEYHGFSLKIYEEPYMVKEGPYLKKGQDFKTRRSRMVEEKRSEKVIDDVLFSGGQKAFVEPTFEKISSFGRQSDLQSPSMRRQSEFQSSPLKKQSDLNHVALVLADEEMPDYEEEELVEETVKNHQEKSDVPLSYKPPQMPFAATTAPITINVVTGERLFANPVVNGLQRDEENELFSIGKRRKSFSPHSEQQVHLDHKPDNNMIFLSREKRIRKFEDDISMVLVPKAVDLIKTKSPVAKRDYRQEEKERQAALRAEAEHHRALSIIRKWRAKVAWRAEERVWRETKLEEALHTFHLGLPVRDKRKVNIRTRDSLLATLEVDFDITEIENQRLIKIQRMWEGLDVIELVNSILRDKSPASKFVCWKLLVCSRVHDIEMGVEGGRNKAGEWLLAKLLHQMPSSKKKYDLLSSRPVLNQSSVVMSNEDKGDGEIPCFYIASDLHFKNGQVEAIETSQGANGLLFLLSESASLTEERGRLHGLVNMLCSGIALPLLVIYSELQESVRAEVCSLYHNLDEAGAIAMFLDMNNLDKTKIACWTVSCALEKSPENAAARDFYSEEILKEGISWLASKAPSQPYLRSVSLHDLVMEHVQPSVKRLLAMEPSRVTPEMCVRSFNEDLLKTAREIVSAASCSYPYSPPTELIDIFREKILGNVESLLPSTGWNEAANLDSILKVLYMCQLPQFPTTDYGQRFNGSMASLTRQKVELEQMLKDYVDTGDYVRLQAFSATIQNACIFKQTANRGHLLIPNWALIFQKLYQTRLTLLNSEVVWVQRPPLEASSEIQYLSTIPDLTKYTSGPTLDEMIEMEIQEVEAFKKSSNSYDILNHPVIGTSTSGSLSLHDVEINSFTSADIEGLLEPYGVARGDGVDFTRLIEARSEGEMKLERMVDEFCRNVDRERDEVARLELDPAENCTYKIEHNFVTDLHQDSKLYALQPELVLDMPQAVEGSSLHVHVESFHEPSVSLSPHIMHSMDDFTKLLERCELVQNSIDRKLDECFRM